MRYADVHCGALSYIFHEYDPPSFPLKFKLSTLEFGTELPTYSSMNISLILVIIEVNLSFLFFIIGTYAFFNTRENFKLYLCFIFYTVIVAMVYMCGFYDFFSLELEIRFSENQLFKNNRFVIKIKKKFHVKIEILLILINPLNCSVF